MPETHPAGNFNIDPSGINSRVRYLVDFKKELAVLEAGA
jgi:hypothetical protein